MKKKVSKPVIKNVPIEFKYKHKIFFTDYMFNCVTSIDEFILINDDETYKKKKEHILSCFKHKIQNDKLRNGDFIGMVNYLPTNDSKDISKSANIIAYIYNNRDIKSDLGYNSSIKIIKDFINNNKLKEITLCGSDILKLSQYGYNINEDLSECKSLKTIFVTNT